MKLLLQICYWVNLVCGTINAACGITQIITIHDYRMAVCSFFLSAICFAFAWLTESLIKEVSEYE